MILSSVEREYEKNSNLRKEDVLEVQEWIKMQKHLPELSEREVIFFLHSNYHEIEGTKNTIENYCSSRSSYKELFSNYDLQSEALQNAHKTITFFNFKKHTPDDRKVILGKLASKDTSFFSFAECLKLFVMVLEANLLEEGTSDGLIICFDMTGVHIGHFIKMGLFTIKHFMFYLQEAMPQRIKGLHFFNTTPIVDKILALVRPFMKQSLFDMLVLHPTVETVFDFVPAELFPNDYPGGQEKSLAEIHDEYFEHILSWQEYFYSEEADKRVNESLRLVKKRTLWNMFGAI